jgi:phosphoribosylamine-glycine ligase
LGIRFVLTPKTLEIYTLDGQRFLSIVEMAEQRNQAQQKAERLAAQLRALGIDPDAE